MSDINSDSFVRFALMGQPGLCTLCIHLLGCLPGQGCLHHAGPLGQGPLKPGDGLVIHRPIVYGQTRDEEV